MKRYNITLKFEPVVNEDAVLDTARKLHNAEMVAAYMANAFDQYPEQEQVWVIILNRRGVPKGRQMITLGTQTESLAHPREVYRAAVLGGAESIIMVHNHPSGDPSPSSADMQVTRYMREAGNALQIPLSDHVIIGTREADPMGRGFYSFQEAGII